MRSARGNPVRGRRWRRQIVTAAVAAMASTAATLATAACATPASAQAAPFNKRHVTFESGDLTLAGYLFTPPGNGPFPAVLWNHGSEPDPGRGPQFDSVAAVFVPAGFVVFAPMRRGHSDSQGEYIRESMDKESSLHGRAAGVRLGVRLLETSQVDDQLAGLAFLKGQPFVDTTRLVVAGCSFGGIQTIFGAARHAGYRAAVSISPAALSWNNSPDLRARLKDVVSKIDIPTFLIQPAKDASLEPSKVLGPILMRRNTANRVKVFPGTGPEAQQAHCFGGAQGMHIWGPEAVAFVQAALK
jgi:carboxymethylenebutenolidase